MKNIKDFEKLLGTTRSIVQRHEDRMSEHGYMFNIFSIMKMERDEVRTHSAMIAELLNPKGRHGQGAVFLKAFLSTLKPQLVNHAEPQKNILLDKLDCSIVKVFKEKSFSGGGDRIDIYVDFKDTLLIIENKIDARDGDKQLQRYDNIGKVSKKKYCLLYLTKYGTEAEDRSSCGVNYSCISYKEHIREWLETCIKEVALVPMVREAIFQYLNLVKKITGVSMSNELNEEIIKLLRESDNIKHVELLEKQVKTVKGRLLYEFFEKIKHEVESADCKSVLDFKENKGGERIYNEQNCLKWFEGGKNKTHSIGLFFDIGETDYLFHIQVATQALHYGLVKVKKSDRKYEIIPFDKEHCIPLPDDKLWKVRNWDRIKWYSVECDNIWLDIETLQKPDKFISELKNNIIYIHENILNNIKPTIF